MADLIPNPPWADRVLERNWEALRAFVGDDLLPVEQQTDTSTREWRELASCGHYGCVYSTHTPGVVFKLTSDLTEAEFVAYAMKLGEWPAGMVRYHQIAALGVWPSARGKDPKDHELFALWREEAFDIGAALRRSEAGKTPPQEEELLDWIDKYLHLARPVWEWIVRENDASKAFVRQVDKRRAWAEETVQRAKTFAGAMGVAREEADKTAMHIAVCRAMAKIMGQLDYGATVGDAFSFYLDRGVIFADVHANNIGTVRRGANEILAITDPGRAAPVDTRAIRPAIPALPGRVRRRPR